MEEVKRTKSYDEKPKNSSKNMYICDKFILMQINLQSVNGRLVSLQATVNNKDVDILICNETNLKGTNKLNLEGYMNFNRNRKNAIMGGISTSVKDKYRNTTLKVSEGKTVEYMVTRHGQFAPAINVINVYGSQES